MNWRSPCRISAITTFSALFQPESSAISTIFSPIFIISFSDYYFSFWSGSVDANTPGMQLELYKSIFSDD